jgi:hypothetical protein
MSTLLKLALTGLASLILSSPAAAAHVALAPTDNLSLSVINDPDNPFGVSDGGRCAGGSNFIQCWMFERFVLPAALPGTALTKAEFTLHASSAPDDPVPLNLYLISDAWQVADMNRYNAPYPGSEGGPLLAFTAVSGEDTHLDLTALVDDAYHGDHVITLMVGTPGYVFNFQIFDQAKTLDLTIAPVPEPDSYILLLAGLGLLGWAARRSKAA